MQAQEEYVDILKRSGKSFVWRLSIVFVVLVLLYPTYKESRELGYFALAFFLLSLVLTMIHLGDCILRYRHGFVWRASFCHRNRLFEYEKMQNVQAMTSVHRRYSLSYDSYLNFWYEGEAIRLRCWSIPQFASELAQAYHRYAKTQQKSENTMLQIKCAVEAALPYAVSGEIVYSQNAAQNSGTQWGYDFFGIHYSRDALYVVPLYLETGKFSCGETICYGSESLGGFRAEPRLAELPYILTLLDKQGNALRSLNIQRQYAANPLPSLLDQREQVTAFWSFIKEWNKKLSAQNPQAAIKKPLDFWKSSNCIYIGITALVIALSTGGPLGIPLGVLGIAVNRVGRKRGNVGSRTYIKLGLVLCVLSILLGCLMTFFWLIILLDKSGVI